MPVPMGALRRGGCRAAVAAAIGKRGSSVR